MISIISIVNYFIDRVVSLAEWVDLHSDFVTAAATATIAFFTLTLWIATKKLWKVSFQQSKDMKISLAIAQEAADAANRSAQLAEDAMISGQRAFVFIKDVIPIKTTSSLDNGRSFNWKITIEWQNMGNTPTKHMLCHTNFNYLPEGFPDDFDYPDVMQEKPRRVVIGPKGIVRHTVIIPFPVVFHPHLCVYMWSWADYNDVFKDTLRHRTEYCWEVKMLKSGVPQFNIYGKHNGHDDECYHKPSPYTPPT
ncbi:MAG: hypothetical protein Q7O12_01310 [Deltaproteobacteria bacterium]|nr:hypothetical protein [Deltaproteobacteria bacterium]